MSVFSRGTFSSSRYGFFTRVMIMAAVTVIAAWLLPGVEIKHSITAAIMTAFVIAVLDNVVRPILLVITLPFSVITCGLFVFFINAVVIKMADGLMGPKFEVDTWGSALLFSLILTIADYLIELPAKHKQQQFDNFQQDDSRDDDEEFTPYEEVND